MISWRSSSDNRNQKLRQEGMALREVVRGMLVVVIVRLCCALESAAGWVKKKFTWKER